MRQLPPTERLRLRAIFSMSGRKRTAQRLIDEWSTAALFHDLLEVPVAQRVSRVPSDAKQITLIGKHIPLKFSMSICPGFGTAVYPTGSPASANATEPCGMTWPWNGMVAAQWPACG
jgi:hypothetical protein